MVTGSFLGESTAGECCWPLTPFYCRDHGRVKLYLYPPSGPHRTCNGITLPFYRLYNGPWLSSIFPRYLSSFCKFYAFLHPYLIDDDHYVTRCSMPSSPLLRETLFEVRSTVRSILSRSWASSPHNEPTPSAVLRTRSSMLNVIFGISAYLPENTPLQPSRPWCDVNGCHGNRAVTHLSSFHGVESRSHGPILIILGTSQLIK
jgi:hypothetical protein